jgi:hypothetical protein
MIYVQSKLEASISVAHEKKPIHTLHAKGRGMYTLKLITFPHIVFTIFKKWKFQHLENTIPIFSIVLLNVSANLVDKN